MKSLKCIYGGLLLLLLFVGSLNAQNNAGGANGNYRVGFFDDQDKREAPYDGDTDIYARVGKFGMAIELAPCNLSFFEGEQLVGLRFIGLPLKNKEVKAFVCRDIYSSERLAEVDCNLPATSGWGWVEVALPNPISIKAGERLFLGYTGSVDQAENPLFVATRAKSFPGSCWMLREGSSWADYSSFLNPVMIQAVFKVKDPSKYDNLSFVSIVPNNTVVRDKADLELKGKILNVGKNPIQTCTVDFIVNAKKTERIHEPVVPLQRMRSTEISFTTDGIVDGANVIALLPKKINTASVPTGVVAEEMKVSVCSEKDGLFEKRILVEMFTGEWCAACPAGKARLVESLNFLSQSRKSRVVLSFIHNRDGVSQKFLIPQAITNLLRHRIFLAGAPYMTIDRSFNEAAGSIGYSPGGVEVIKKCLNSAFADDKSVVELNLNVEKGENGQPSKATITGRVNKALISGADLYMTMLLQKNNLKVVNKQEGIADEEQAKYRHIHAVVMSLSNLGGDLIKVAEDGSFIIKKEFVPNVDISETDVVAFVHPDQSRQMAVLNAAMAHLQTSESVSPCLPNTHKVYSRNGRIVTEDDAAGVEVFSLDGQFVPNESLPAGIYIARVTINGVLFFEKVLVK